MTFANLSGGRDSTAMVVRYLELGGEIDYIIFCDTHYEFPQMLEYIDKLESYLLKHFNKSLTRLRNDEDLFSKWAYKYPITRGENKGKLRGVPRAIGLDYCTRELKAKPSRAFIKDKSPNAFKTNILIGYTYDEVENGRTSSLDYGIAKYPLHKWGWNELEVKSYSQGIEALLIPYINTLRGQVVSVVLSKARSPYILFIDCILRSGRNVRN